MRREKKEKDEGGQRLQRLLVVWCPALLREGEHGREARLSEEVRRAVSAFSPAVEPVRPGVCAVPTRGPSRYFGGDELLAHRVAEALPDGPAAGQVGVADGLFAAVLAARAATDGPVVVPPGRTPDFLASFPVEVLEQPELADLLRRLGIRTLGRFAALPTEDVLARLGNEGAVCHAVAAGRHDVLPGLRARSRTPAPTPASSGTTRHQPGFWGESGEADARAERAVAAVCQLLHPEAVVVGRLQGGRGPAERGRLVPWAGRRLASSRFGPEPWPGQLPPPAPVVVLPRPLPVALVDDAGDSVTVTADAMVSSAPERLSVSGGPWTPVTAWAGPWPADERWWQPGARRRRARMQLLTGDGAACLLVREHGGWWLEGAYD